MDKSLFIQPSAYIRVCEKRLLGKTFYERLVGATDLDEALKILSETSYGEFISKQSRSQDYEVSLASMLLKSTKEALSVVKDEDLIKFFTLKYEYHNLKVIVKEIVRDVSFENLYIDLDGSDFRQLKNDYIMNKKTVGNERYFNIIRQVHEGFKEDKDPSMIDIRIDRLYFMHMLELAQKMDVELFKDYITGVIDMTNVKTLIRCKRQEREAKFLDIALIEGGDLSLNQLKAYLGTPIDSKMSLIKNLKCYRFLLRGLKAYEETKSLSELERQIDDYIVELLRSVKTLSYGPEVIFAYLMGREMEIKNLRIILVSKINELPAEFIKERLRESYV